MKVLVEAPMSTFTGYGNDGIGLIQALMRWGCDVYVNPTGVDPPLPESIAMLLTRRLERPFDLAIHHVDPGNMELENFKAPASKVNVAWTMWEYSTLDNMAGRSLFKKATNKFDAILGYDEVTVEALRPYVGRHVAVKEFPDGTVEENVTRDKVALAVLQGGFWPETWPERERDWFGDRFGFCMAGQLHERKDPFVAIEAFRELKQEKGDEFEGAELHLKTQVPGLHPIMEQWTPKLRIHYKHWPREILREFYAKQHCLLAPSRGEGKNMPALEFMSSGGTVIATNWGGHTGWLSDQYAYPLDYKLMPISDRFPNCENARASKDHLKELMWHVYSHRDEAMHKGKLAAKLIPQMCSWDAVVERLFLRLKDVLPDKTMGEQLYAKAQTCRQERVEKTP